MEGLVSVIIPTYNRYELLNHSIKSVLDSTYKNIEIIVVNDCSTDNRYYSGDLEKYEKTTVIHLPINQREKYNKNYAQGMTRNCGLEIAKGEWIAFLDDDDFYLPNKLDIQISLMKHHSYKFSSTNMFLINHNQISVDKLDFNIINKYFEQNLPQVFNSNLISRSNYINNSTVVIHRSIVAIVGNFNLVNYEDWDYWKRALEHTNCLYISEPLVYYTKTINNNENIKNYIYD